MLATRLDQLERAGVVTRWPKPEGCGHHYGLTAAGRDLADVIAALGAWGERWIEVTTERSDPAFALWAWHRVQVDRSRLPDRPVVVAFVFPDEAPTNRRYWLRVERADIELCYSDPGGEPDLWVTAASLPFVDWHRGVRAWTDVVGAGDVRVDGPRALARALPTWHLDEPVVG